MPQISKQRLLLSHLFHPKTWQAGPYPERLEKTLSSLFQTECFSLNSGRSALFVALKALGVAQGDEVLIQAYTCNAVPNPVLWIGATPVYVDIDEDSLNMELADLESKITERSKVIIVQHTFGNPAKVQEILKIAEKYKLKVIEDCAHSLGARVEGKLLGTFGDMAIFSFGREKVISSLTGGALIVNNKGLLASVEEQLKTLPEMSRRRIIQELGNFFAWRVLLRKIHQKDWGKNLVGFLYHFDLVNVVTSQKELSGINPGFYPAKLANIFAHLALLELDNFVEYNRIRAETADKYYRRITNTQFKLLPSHQGIYLRVIAFHPKAHLVLEEAREKGFHFGNWYNSVIYPESVHLAKLGYQSGSCPVAEKIAHQTLNLPNYLGIEDKEVERVIDFVNNF